MPLTSPRSLVLALAVGAAPLLLAISAGGCRAQRGDEPQVAADEPISDAEGYGTTEQGEPPIALEDEPVPAGEVADAPGRRGLRFDEPFPKHTRSRRPDYFIEIAGPAVTTDTAVAIDITNTSGPVTVIVDERLETASVKVRPVWIGLPREQQPDWTAVDAVDWGTAEHVVEHPEHSILRVFGTPLALGTDHPEPALEIIVQTPTADGLLIRNGSGPIAVTNARGAMTIENGVAGGEGGPIAVRTDHPVDAPINFFTPAGDVLLVTVPESQGTVRLLAPEGRTVFNVRPGRVTEVRDTPEGYIAVWNSGRNEIVLRSGADDTRIYTTTKPSMNTFNEFDPVELDDAFYESGIRF